MARNATAAATETHYHVCILITLCCSKTLKETTTKEKKEQTASVRNGTSFESSAVERSWNSGRHSDGGSSSRFPYIKVVVEELNNNKNE